MLIRAWVSPFVGTDLMICERGERRKGSIQEGLGEGVGKGVGDSYDGVGMTTSAPPASSKRFNPESFFFSIQTSTFHCSFSFFILKTAHYS